MNPQHDRVESIFAAAVARPADARAAYLDQVCGDDAELRRRVEGLLQAHVDAGSFLEKPALGASLTTDAPAGQWIDRDAVAVPREAPGMRVGPYKLLQQIGEGGMGVVFMAEQERPVRRRVALKIIKPGMDSSQVIARFEAERQALALMDHPNIAKVLDAGATESGRPYFVMELVYGVPITKFCDDSQLTPRQRLELFVPICHAIQHAHQKGIIHRDIKPSNVLVTMHDDKPVPKVIDFGVAKATEQRLTDKSLFTAFGAMVGTLEYMSPEQAEMNAFGVDTRGDVYSLGVLLYELLTGTTPLERKRLREAAYTEVLRLIKEVEPPRPSARLSSSGDLPKLAAARKMEPARLSRLLRGEIDWIVMRCLEKDRTRRYESASALARDVERYLRDEAVEACPPSVGYRLRKFVRKYRVALTTAAAFAALLLIASGVSIWLAVVAGKAEAIASKKQEDAEKAGEQAVQERDRAQKESQRAEEAAKQARASAAAMGRAMDRINVAKGLQLAEEENLYTALAWFVKPLERENLTPEEERIHRTRIACYLRHTPGQPRLRQVFFCDKPLSRGAAFSADGKRMLAVAEEIVYVWDIRSGKLLAKLPHSEPVQAAAFSPDGKRVFTCAESATSWTWDADSGRRLDVSFVDWAGLLQRPSALLSSSPWQILGSAVADPLLYGRWFGSDSEHVHAEISDNASRVLFTFPKSLRLVDLETHKLLGQWPNDWNFIHGGDSHSLSSDGRCLVHIQNGVIRVHDTYTGKLSSRTIRHGKKVDFVTLSPDGTRAQTFGDGFSQIWDARAWKPLTRIELKNSTNRRTTTNAAFSHDNRLVAFWSVYGGTISWWNVGSGQFVGETPDTPEQGLGYSWRPGSQQLLELSRTPSREIVIRDAASGGQTKLVLTRFGVFDAIFAPDGRTLATVSRDGVICIWDFCDRNEEFAWQEPVGDDINSDIRLHRFVNRSGTYQLDSKGAWEVKTISGTKQFRRGPQRFLPQGTDFFSGALSPDRNRVATVRDLTEGGFHSDGLRIVQLWDANTRQVVGKPLEIERPDRYKCVVFSPDSRMFATARNSGVAHLYNARTGELIGKPLKHDGAVYFATFSPNSEFVVTCSADRTARLWQAKNSEPVARILRHRDEVTCAAFAPNGEMVATGSLDGTLRLWNTHSGMPVGMVELQKGFPRDLAFHPTGSLLMVALADQKGRSFDFTGKIKIFDIASLQEVSPEVKGVFDSDSRILFGLRRDGRFAFGRFDKRTWDLAPDTRPASDLTKLGEIYSGLRTDASGSSFSLSRQELQSIWQDLHAKYPQEFAVSPKAAVKWRIEQIQSASRMNRPDLAVFHRRWLAVELAEAGWQPGERGNEDMELDNYLQRLYTLALHGRHSEASAAADALAVRWNKDQETLYNCACVHALAAGAVKGDAALAERYAARAVTLLGQAVAAGYNDSQHMGKDSDLDALRRRDDFRALLKKLDGKKP